MARSLKLILHARQIVATETTVSPAPETSITFSVADSFNVLPFSVFKKIPLLERVSSMAFAEISSLNFEVVSFISSKLFMSGLVFNPATSLDYLDYVMDKVDMVLLMSVNPGFGGQKFIPETLNKLRMARKKIDEYTEKSGREIWLEVDGGVNADNIAEIAKAGADTFVAGSAIFKAANADDPNSYDTILKSLRSSLSKV